MVHIAFPDIQGESFSKAMPKTCLFLSFIRKKLGELRSSSLGQKLTKNAPPCKGKVCWTCVLISNPEFSSCCILTKLPHHLLWKYKQDMVKMDEAPELSTFQPSTGMSPGPLDLSGNVKIACTLYVKGPHTKQGQHLATLSLTCWCEKWSVTTFSDMSILLLFISDWHLARFEGVWLNRPDKLAESTPDWRVSSRAAQKQLDLNWSGGKLLRAMSKWGNHTNIIAGTFLCIKLCNLCLKSGSMLCLERKA